MDNSGSGCVHWSPNPNRITRFQLWGRDDCECTVGGATLNCSLSTVCLNYPITWMVSGAILC